MKSESLPSEVSGTTTSEFCQKEILKKLSSFDCINPSSENKNLVVMKKKERKKEREIRVPSSSVFAFVNLDTTSENNTGKLLIS